MYKLKYLSRIEIFRGLSLPELKKIERDMDIPASPTRRGGLIASPHQKQQMIYLIKSGSVRVYTITGEGKELTLDVLSAGHLFSNWGTFSAHDGIYAVTLEDSIVCEIQYDRFKQILREKPELGILYIEMLSARLREVEELLEHMAYSSVRVRLLYLLHKLSEKFGNVHAIGEHSKGEPGWVLMDVDFTHYELASMTGSLRETVSEMMKRFETEGIIKKEGHQKRFWVQTERLLDSLNAGK